MVLRIGIDSPVRAAWFTVASLSSTMPSSGIGSMEMQKLKPYHMENLYTTLSKTPCGSYVEGKKQELTEKQKQRFLSGTTIHEVHRLLGTAFQYAVEWGILVKIPVPVDSPKKSTQERTIWTVEEMRAALDSMDDPILHLAVHLTLVGALREGEIVGLTPEDLDFDTADGIETFRADPQKVSQMAGCPPEFPRIVFHGLRHSSATYPCRGFL